MYELQWLAFQADLTRVVTFMLGRELNFRTYPEIGLTQGHHTMSHHQEKPENIERYAKLNTYQTDLFAAFLSKLASTPEGDGTLLDHSLFLYGARAQQPELARALSICRSRVVGGPAGGRRRAAPRRAEQTRRCRTCCLTLLDRVGVPHRVARRQHGARRSDARAMRTRASRWLSLLLRARVGAAAADAARCSRPRRRHGASCAAARRAARIRTRPTPTARPRCTGPCTAATLDGVRALLAAGAAVDAANRYGVRPAYLAAENGDAATMRALLEAGADRERRVRRGRDVADDGRAHGRRRDDRGFARGRRRRRRDREPRRANRADVGGRREQRRRRSRRCSKPAPSATRARRRASSRRSAFAVRAGAVDADERVARSRRRCERDVARRHEHARAGRAEPELRGRGALLDHGADPNAAVDGWTALHQIARVRRWTRGFNLPGPEHRDQLSSLELVAQARARAAPTSTRAQTRRSATRGTTPFLLATKSLDLPYMRTLLELGADPTLKADDGTTAVMVAAGVGQGQGSAGAAPGSRRGSARGARRSRSSSAPARSTTSTRATRRRCTASCIAAARSR